MAQLHFLFALAVGASAFSLTNRASTRTTSALMSEKSQALPFLKRPEKLDGSMIGDVGFDPLELSAIQPDLKYARSAELKHGRIAMLATVGFIAEEYIHLPGPDYQNPNPIAAISTVPLAANLQILFFCGAIELATIDITYGEGEPGDYGFDPSKILNNKSQEQIDDLKLKELSNGRLAMMAFVGMLVQTLLFNKPLFQMFF